MTRLFRLLRGASDGQVAQFEVYPTLEGLQAALELGRVLTVPDSMVVQAFLQDFVDSAGLKLTVDVIDIEGILARHQETNGEQ